MKNGFWMSTVFITKWETTRDTKTWSPSTEDNVLCMVEYERCHPLWAKYNRKQPPLLRRSLRATWIDKQRITSQVPLVYRNVIILQNDRARADSAKTPEKNC